MIIRCTTGYGRDFCQAEYAGERRLHRSHMGRKKISLSKQIILPTRVFDPEVKQHNGKNTARKRGKTIEFNTPTPPVLVDGGAVLG